MNPDRCFDEFCPRVIVWQIHPEAAGGSNGRPSSVPAVTPPVFSTRECLLTIDSITRTCKPIVVLAGGRLLERGDIVQIVEYGVALGLKMILEVAPDEISDDVLRAFSKFGPRIFRLVVNETIIEDMDTRYRQSGGFRILEQAVKRLNDSGFEVHLSAHIVRPDIRALAFDHDYAMRRSARGLYCHLSFSQSPKTSSRRRINEPDYDRFIEEIALIKSFSPEQMYFSPQCVRYGHKFIDQDFDVSIESNNGRDDPDWQHWCLAGRTYGFIDYNGTVRACAGLEPSCGNLRDNGYNFKDIWEHSTVLLRLRGQARSCAETRAAINPKSIHSPDRNVK